MARTKKSKPPKNISNSLWQPLVVDQQDEEDYEPLPSSGIDEGKFLSYFYDLRTALLTTTLDSPSNILTHRKTARKINPRVQARKERDHWVLTSEASLTALRALEDLIVLRLFSRVGNVLTLEGPSEDGVYLVQNGHSRMECVHHVQPPSDGSVVYVGCAAMLYLGFYWSPVLGCIVSPEGNSIILADDLRSLVYQGIDLDPQIIDHILSAFQIKDQQLAVLFQTKLREEVVKIPIPGLREAEARYQCSDCGIWCSTPKNHFKKSQKCKNVTERSHSIPLYPPSDKFQSSKGTDYRVQLFIPDHRNPSIVKACDPPLPHSLQSEWQDAAENEPLIETWTDVDFANPCGPRAPKLAKKEQAFYFSTLGHKFCCLHPSVSPQPDSHIYTGCAVLSFFQCFLSPVLKAVVQPQKFTLLDVAGLKKLFSSREHGQAVELLVAHITESFDLLPAAEPYDMFEAVHKHLVLSAPLKGLPDPKSVVQCQACSQCFSSDKLHQLHQRAQHPDEPASSVGTHAIRLWHANKYANYRIVMNASWPNSPSEEPRVRIPVLSYQNPPHLRDSGFQEHLESWGICDYSVLHRLFGLPSQVESESWTLGSHSQKLNDCIPRVHRLLGIYLLDAEHRMQHSHNLRRLIALISYAPGLTGKFNSILSESLLNSRHLISMMLAAMIRYISLQLGSRYDKDPDKQICITRLKELRSLRLETPTSAQSVLQTFTMGVVSSNDSPSDSYLLDFMHKFLLALYTARYSENIKISSVLEQTLIFICLTEDLKWKSARRTYDEISHCFRWGRTLLVHTAALGGMDNKYTSPPRSANCQVITELNDGASDKACDLLEATTSDADLGPEQQSDEESGLPRPNWELIAEHVGELSKKLINVEDRGNLVSRLYSIRSSARKEARTEPLSHQVVWHKDGTMLDLSWAYIHGRSFELSVIRQAAVTATEKLNQALLDLIPGTMEAIVTRLSISSFKEEWDADSIFSSLPSHEALSPVVGDLHASIVASVREQRTTLETILERSQAFLKALAVALYLTTGIPPYASQVSQFRYASLNDIPRHLRLLEGGHGAFMIPSDKDRAGYQQKGRDNLWLIPPQVTHPILIYLGVFRPVEAFLLKSHALRSKAILDQTPLHTHIFCNPHRRGKSILWSADDVNNAVQGGPLGLDAFPHRFLFEAIMLHEHDGLTQSLQYPSVLDAQGQHTQKTSHTNYAVPQLQRFSGIQFSCYDKQMLSCEAIHSFCYLAKPIAGEHWTQRYIRLDDVIHRNQGHALLIARTVVACDYGLGSSLEAAAVLSRSIYHDQPFLLDPSAGTKPHFGDKGLIQVVLALLHRPAPLLNEDGLTSPWTSDELIVATASSATLILAGLSEWFTGCLQPYEGDISLLFGGWKELVNEICAEIEMVIRKIPESWESYLHHLQHAIQGFSEESKWAVVELALPEVDSPLL